MEIFELPLNLRRGCISFVAEEVAGTSHLLLPVSSGIQCRISYRGREAHLPSRGELFSPLLLLTLTRSSGRWQNSSPLLPGLCCSCTGALADSNDFCRKFNDVL
jgi:hypothetical protein